MKHKKGTILLFLLFVFLFCSFFYPSISKSPVSAPVILSKKASFHVLIDAGHGGFDSGKVGVDGTLEKDINLKIAKKLESLLSAADIKVSMTRTEDRSLAEEASSSKKQADMKKRASLMNEKNYDCIISIHQNSYPDEAVHGAQVFFYTPSEEGSRLARILQSKLVAQVDPSNYRTEKSNDTYYLLKNASAPAVIVECGFLSNWSESKKLVDDAYQHKLAWAIHLGVLQYLNGSEIN